MIEFRINSEALDFDANFDISFKWENNALNLNSYSFGRSVSFSIPKTPKNERILKNESNILLGGEFSRSENKCEMYYSGGVVTGTLLISSYDGSSYSACFIFENSGIKDFLESKIANFFASDETYVANEINVTSEITSGGFLRYVSKQNGLAGMLPKDAPDIKMLVSIQCRKILEKLGLGYGSNTFPQAVSDAINSDYLLFGNLKPAPVEDFVGALGTDSVPLALQSAISITTETGSSIKTWSEGNIFNPVKSKRVTLPRCYIAIQDMIVKINATANNGTIMVEREGEWKACGMGTDGHLKPQTPQYREGLLTYKIYLEANQEFKINAGERFIFLNSEGVKYWREDIVDNYYYLSTSDLADYDMQLYNLLNVTISIVENNEADYGEPISIGGSLPDMSVFKFVSMLALSNGYVPLFSTGGNNGQSIEFWDWTKSLTTAIVLDSAVISINKVERKVGNFATKNIFKFNDKIENTYFSENTTLGEYSVVDSKLRTSEDDGSFDDFSDDKLSKDTFYAQYRRNGDIALGRKVFVLNANLKKIIEKSTMVEVSVNYPLFRSMKLHEKQVFLLNGQTYFCLSANFSEKVATLQLVLC